MGVYYIIVNHYREEWVEPWGSLKMPSVMTEEAARLARKAWDNEDIDFVSDCATTDGSCEDDYVRNHYRNVTAAVRDGSYVRKEQP